MPQPTQGPREAAQILLPQQVYPDLHFQLEEAEEAFKNCNPIWCLHSAEFDELRRLLNECKLLVDSERGKKSTSRPNG
ncbi:hypothetical protein PspLS_10441 [Pyricularia sp. CBS 133598]|nr:hypothetical protein PspLS_10441 [Pyricularia sp. CBS 133598]